MYLFDTHAHLQDEPFEADFNVLLVKLEQNRVGRVVLPGSDLPDSRKAAELALRHPGLYCALGFHPHEAASWTETSREELKELILETEAAGKAQGRERVVVAVGEIGLDYHYDFSPSDIQAKVYREQLELAAELNLPVVIHEREAFADSLEILRQAKKDGLLELPFDCHCYSGSVEGAELLLELGAYLGFDGPITFKNARKAPDVLASLPADRFLLETDSPYLTPVPFRGKRNDPSYLEYIARKAAEIRNSSYEEIVEQNWQNACRFYRLDPEKTSEIISA